jgi:hypothetical protein
LTEKSKLEADLHEAKNESEEMLTEFTGVLEARVAEFEG